MDAKPLVYISYSQKDKSFLDELLNVIRPFALSAQFVIGNDADTKPGAEWSQQIGATIEQADIAVLFISADYLAGKWTSETELPRLLARQEEGELRILPLIVRPAAWVHTPLAYLQVWPRDGRALSSFAPGDRDRLWSEFVEVFISVLHDVEERSADSKLGSRVKRRRARSAAKENSRVFFVSHAKEDGDFAENLQSRMARDGLMALIDIDLLEAGMDWRSEIDGAIIASRALILILSPDSKASEYVTYEWAFGLGKGLRIVPLLLRETSIHPRLEVFQYLDFTNRRARPWGRLSSLLRSL